MTTTEIFIKKLNNFKSKIITSQRKETTAGFLLFKDYLSKMFLWYEKISIVEDFENNIYKKKEGHNLIYLIAPEILDECISLEDFRLNYLNDVNFGTSKYRGFEYIFIYYSIYWDIFNEKSQFKNYNNLPNPYESVIKILLRGNNIYKGEMNSIEIDNLTVRKQTDFKLPSLDYDFLDYIDEVCERSGSAGIPNQEKTNQLWEEFQKIRQNG